jgi:thiamine pyrophosphate-dependent acetolactate synthase large subunit-like protein
MVPPEDLLRQAADVLNAGRKVAMLVGAGALEAGPQVERVAERLGAGVAKALLGKAVIPDDLPYVTGSVGCRFVVVVLNNGDLNYVTWEQRAMEGDPRYVESQALPDLPYAAFARMLGFDGVRVERPEEIEDAWDRALASDRPFVIDAVVDAAVPTLPPELEEEVETKLTQALSSGDPDAEAVLEQLRLQEIVQIGTGE